MTLRLAHDLTSLASRIEALRLHMSIRWQPEESFAAHGFFANLMRGMRIFAKKQNSGCGLNELP
jgi:hypothetical protein